MIRLYVDLKFEKGQKVPLPAEEVRYFRSVRRGRGPVQLFNRAGQIAFGEVTGGVFCIDRVERSAYPVHPVWVAVACPDLKIIPLMMKALSAMGVQALLFFSAERSQTRNPSLARLEKISLESARQCERPEPLLVEVTSDNEFEFAKKFSKTLFLDEDPSSLEQLVLKSASRVESVLLIVGPEGGWTERERDIARQRQFQFCHLRTPILRVETAAICGAFLALERFFGIAS